MIGKRFTRDEIIGIKTKLIEKYPEKSYLRICFMLEFNKMKGFIRRILFKPKDKVFDSEPDRDKPMQLTHMNELQECYYEWNYNPSSPVIEITPLFYNDFSQSFYDVFEYMSYQKTKGIDIKIYCEKSEEWFDGDCNEWIMIEGKTDKSISEKTYGKGIKISLIAYKKNHDIIFDNLRKLVRSIEIKLIKEGIRTNE